MSRFTIDLYPDQRDPLTSRRLFSLHRWARECCKGDALAAGTLAHSIVGRLRSEHVITQEQLVCSGRGWAWVAEQLCIEIPSPSP